MRTFREGKLYTSDMGKLRDISGVGGKNEWRTGEKRPVCTLWKNKSIWSSLLLGSGMKLRSVRTTMLPKVVLFTTH